MRKIIDLNVLQLMSNAIKLVFNLFVGVNSTSSSIQLSVFSRMLRILFHMVFCTHICAYVDRQIIHRCFFGVIMNEYQVNIHELNVSMSIFSLKIV